VSSSTDRFARTADRIAARQDSRAARLAAEVRDFVHSSGEERALDVGTGAGALAFALAPLVREVVGLDPVPELLELARARGLPNTEFVEGDGTALPFADAAFDLAGTHRTLHHIAEPERVVAELARVTRPGGHVLVVDQLAPDDPAMAAALHEFETVRDPSHTRLLTDAELRALFAANGLSLLRERHEDERRDLASYLDRAGCEGERRVRAEVLASADSRVLVASAGWYLLARLAPGDAAVEVRERLA
jgi:ubiquinone/menaquinone biosynthesis C-methylase UbiE